MLCLSVALAACGGSGSDGASASSSSSSTPSSSTPSSSTRPNRGNVDGKLVIGQLAPQTGLLQPLLQSFTRPAQMAVDEINFAGGIGGAPVGLVVADDGSDQIPTAQASLRALLDAQHADAILGPSSSGTALRLLDDVAHENVIMCSGSNTRAELSVHTGNGRYFRTSPSDLLQGDALAQLVARDGRKQPVVLASDDSYGAAIAAPLVGRLRKQGIRPGPVLRFDPQGTDAAARAQAALERKPDAVVIVGLAATSAPVVQALLRAGAGPAQMPTYGTDGLQGSGFGAAVDATNARVVAGIKGTAPAAAPAGITSPFLAAFAATGIDPVYSASTYDCTVLLALAAVKAGGDDPALMRKAFAKNLRGSTDCATFAECRVALQAGKSIHYHGASSSFDHWRGHEPGTGVYDVWSYDPDGRVANAPPDQQITAPAPG